MANCTRIQRACFVARKRFFGGVAVTLTCLLAVIASAQLPTRPVADGSAASQRQPVGNSIPATGPIWNGDEPKTAMEWAAYVSTMSRRGEQGNVDRGVDALVKIGPPAIPALMVYLGDNPTRLPFPIAVALSRIEGAAPHVAAAKIRAA